MKIVNVFKNDVCHTLFVQHRNNIRRSFKKDFDKAIDHEYYINHWQLDEIITKLQKTGWQIILANTTEVFY